MPALVTHAPETGRDMQMMRQHINGPPNYSVVSAPDYCALGRVAAAGAALRLVELRMARGIPAGHVRMVSRS
jgi:hypothetical protein